MACRKRQLSGEESGVAATISDALLFATMCIVGFPVDAYLKDHSVYSGIFFTASVGDNSGIVLKNARMIKKGKCATNVGSGGIIETLVVRFADLLEVVAKGTALPENGAACSIAGDPFKVIFDNIEASKQKEEAPIPLGNVRQAEGDTSQGDLVDCDKKFEMNKNGIKNEVQGSLPVVDTCIARSNSVREVCSDSPSKMLPNGDVSDHPIPSTDKLNDQCQISSVNSARLNDAPSHVATRHISAETVHSKHSKPTPNGSKLNPEAQLFSPSFTNHKSLMPPAVPTVTNVAYVPDNYSVGPIASPQPDVENNSFVSRSSLPMKFLSHGNLVPGNSFSDSQYSQSFIGHMGSRTQAVRYGGQQLHPIHTGPTYVTSNPQNIMVGRGGQQLIYMHPVSHNVNQATGAFSQVSLQPSLTPQIGHLLKHQGNVASPALQLYVNPPFMSDGQQQIAVQSHSSFHPPPFPVIHSISVPGAATTGFFTPKFP